MLLSSTCIFILICSLFISKVVNNDEFHRTYEERGYLVKFHKNIQVNQNSIYVGRLVYYQEYRLIMNNKRLTYVG